MRTRSAARAVIAVLGLALVSHGASADEEKQACVSAYEQGQFLKKEGKLRASREKLRTCARDVCPALVRNDCVTWLDQVDRTLPSVVIEAKRDEGDITAAKVTLDGAAVATRLDGKAIEVEPGEHTVRVEPEGLAPIEQTIVVREGEKNRAISFSFRTKHGGDAKDADHPGEAAAPDRPIPIGVWVLGGLGVIGVGTFAVLGSLGANDEQSLRSTCAPSCTQADSDAVHTKFIAADVALGVGAASLVGAAIWYFARPTTSKEAGPPAGPTVASTKDGATIGWRGVF